MKSILFVLLSVLVVRAELIRGEVELTGLQGEIALKSASGGQSRNLSAGDALREDDELTTAVGSSAELVFSNGVRIVVAPGTSIKLSMFRQVKTPAPNRRPREGELPNEGSVLDLSLKAGHVTVLCPSLQSRSLVSVRTPQGRSDLVQEGVYEIGFSRVASGEWVARSVVLSGVLVFVPAGKGAAKTVTVESGNKLLATSELGAQLVLEKTKMDGSEVEALTKAMASDFHVSPTLPKATAKIEATAPNVMANGRVGAASGMQLQEQVVQSITKEVIERLVESNPSPAGG